MTSVPVPKPITVETVRGELAAGRDLGSGSAPWTLRFIDLADAQCHGVWHEVELDGLDALAVVLPPHAGEPCKGDRLMLVADAGSVVRDAAETLRRLADRYARENPSCWSRIMEASTAAFSTLILTTTPIDTDEHRRLERRASALYHLDGFHRLLGWAIAGRLTADARVRGHVAGPVDY
jgi:hypothetical protein